MGCLWLKALENVVGKRIHGIVVSENPESPQNQVFLVFHDQTYLELYGNQMSGSNEVDQGGMREVMSYITGRKGTRVLLETCD